MIADAHCAYAVVPAGTRLIAVDGVADALSPAVTAGSVAAIVRRAPPPLQACAEGGASHAVSRQGSNAMPAAIEEEARVHHAITAAAAMLGPCLPLAFGTIFADLDHLEAWLRPRAERLAVALARVADHAEWLVSLDEDLPSHERWLAEHDEALGRMRRTARDAGPGASYLLGRSFDRALADVRQARHATLAGAVAGACRGPTDSPEAARRVWATTSNGPWTVFLAHCDIAALNADLEPLAELLSGTGFTIRVSGPWPAAAFAREVQADA